MDVFIFWTYIEEQNPKKTYHNSHKLLSEDAVTYIKKINHPGAKGLSFGGRILLRHALIKCNKGRFLDTTISYNQFNRPYIYNSGIDFNISHSNNIVACAITENGRLGIDIEKIRQVEVKDFKRVFTENEIKHIINSTDVLGEFFNKWTQKEAIMKANGKGFHLKPASFEVHEGSVIVEQDNWFLYPITLADGYICHLATSKQAENVEIIKIEKFIPL